MSFRSCSWRFVAFKPAEEFSLGCKGNLGSDAFIVEGSLFFEVVALFPVKFFEMS